MAQTGGEFNPENIDRSKIDPSFLAVIRQREELKSKLSGIKHKIGVYSAKGGVGKTTTAVNLAYALSSMGFKVGILDADIDTPNVTYFVGYKGEPPRDYPLKPIEVGGVKIISTAMFFQDSGKPIIWRGPMLTKMLKEFFADTQWGELDYLIIDLPPGSSDSPLTIMQLIPLDGFVLVTTPQHIAAINTIKSGTMAKKFGLALLGVVENMSSGTPKGASEVAESLGCDVLGMIKADQRIADFSDEGKVAVLEDSRIKEAFIDIVKRLIS
ncbi:MAG: Mrp/NBP35 family ATP-binding protein [Candidatus Micrarchaeota archaeon]|nr:Mrp/NBP35 family ATP-binding protein [Candidatus Micrarchaeota archaeon]MDE1804691.1 Mrp/NBP35 family ATP-binding protein [Candidatus Micrarchaeota archaeon]MDE1846799.1 Mrp/NBP35 family ATP-binding protein [Candidatus Micrarchaeota archaeon]